MKGKPTEAPSSAAADILAVVDAAGPKAEAATPVVTPPAAVPAGPVDPYVWKQAAAASDVTQAFPQAAASAAASVAKAVVNPMLAIMARLSNVHPARAEEIAKGVTPVGPPVVSRVPVKVPGGWDQKVLSTHQKYRLNDGTILPLEV